MAIELPWFQNGPPRWNFGPHVQLIFLGRRQSSWRNKCSEPRVSAAEQRDMLAHGVSRG